MRTLLMVLMIAGLMSTVGVYAGAFGSAPALKALSGGTTSVTSSTSGATQVLENWTMDSASDVSAAVITWTPTTAGDYDITVTAGSTTGTLNIPSSGSSERTTDSVPLSPAVLASAITDAKVVIEQN